MSFADQNENEVDWPIGCPYSTLKTLPNAHAPVATWELVDSSFSPCDQYNMCVDHESFDKKACVKTRLIISTMRILDGASFLGLLGLSCELQL